MENFKNMKFFLLFYLLFHPGAEGRRQRVESDDTEETIGFLCYVHARLFRHHSPSLAREATEECKESHYTKSITNAFQKRRILTQKLVAEAAGDVCYFLSQMQGLSTSLSLEHETNCEKSLYIPYIFQLNQEGRITPKKDAIKEAAGDFCYYFTKVWNYLEWPRYTQRTLQQLRMECQGSSYVGYVYDLADKGKLIAPNQNVLQEIVGDICFYTSKMILKTGVKAAINNRKSCRKSNYVSVLYGVVQKKNLISLEFAQELAGDVGYNYEVYWKKSTKNKAMKVSKKWKRSPYVGTAHGLIQTILTSQGWELEFVDSEEDYNYD